MNSKFSKELDELVANNVISEAVASDIRNYYQLPKEASPNKLFTVFGVLGSLLVGLGIILILAHNWDNFSRAIKTIFAFLPLIFGQLAVGYSIFKAKSATWKESSGTFLFFAVGCSIALISQIYNIPGNLNSFILTWIVLCLPLIYLLKSHAVAILEIAFITFYAWNLGYGYPSTGESPWFYLVLMALVIPHYLQLIKENPKGNITSIFNWILLMSLVITLGAFIKDNEDFGFLMYMTLFGLFYIIGRIPFFENQKLRRNGYLIFGSIGTIIILLMTSFRQMWEFGMSGNVIFSQEFYITLTLFITATIFLVYSYSKGWIQRFNLFPVVYVIFTALFFAGMANSLIATILVNVLVLMLGLVTIKIGVDKFHFGILNYGLFIITALVVCRFFDTDMSYVIRGILFVVVGIGFFLANYIMLKRKKFATNTKSVKP